MDIKLPSSIDKDALYWETVHRMMWTEAKEGRLSPVVYHAVVQKETIAYAEDLRRGSIYLLVHYPAHHMGYVAGDSLPIEHDLDILTTPFTPLALLSQYHTMPAVSYFLQCLHNQPKPGVLGL